jgi:predicted TIM-barrel fold metal-dependent hydrolase
MKDVLRRHPKTTIIWAHLGLGRVVHPVQAQASPMSRSAARASGRSSIRYLAMRRSVTFYFDISWDEVAKYAVSSPETIKNSTEMLNKYPDRFLFGTTMSLHLIRLLSFAYTTCGRRSGQS